MGRRRGRGWGVGVPTPAAAGLSLSRLGVCLSGYVSISLGEMSPGLSLFLSVSLPLSLSVLSLFIYDLFAPGVLSASLSLPKGSNSMTPWDRQGAGSSPDSHFLAR